jgi:hypothetical protein
MRIELSPPNSNSPPADPFRQLFGGVGGLAFPHRPIRKLRRTSVNHDGKLQVNNALPTHNGAGRMRCRAQVPAALNILINKRLDSLDVKVGLGGGRPATGPADWRKSAASRPGVCLSAANGPFRRGAAFGALVRPFCRARRPIRRNGRPPAGRRHAEVPGGSPRIPG